ncbi:MAG: serine/threonine protein kinase [Candidatus Competibacteraceae bacterium]|nr:serine/threonine protein kinase [Candidatus Competibacteraceae bacterium]
MIDIAYPVALAKNPDRRAGPPSLRHRAKEKCAGLRMDMIDTTSSTIVPTGRLAERSLPINTLWPGHLLDEYLIDCVLGAGGFGVTYKAWDTLLETWVALKEYFPLGWSFRDGDGVTVYPNTQGGSRAIDDNLSNYLWGLERFLEEARVLARVQHPYVVRVKRYFRAHGTAYIVMDYEEGQPLSAVLGEGETLDEAEVRGLLEDVLPALRTVHEQGFLHRDIKPSNLYIRAHDHRVILIDFGAAREAVSQQGRSMTSLVTPGYSPPEQYTTRSERYGAWTDLYALGAVLYRCVTGRAPVEAAERLLEDRLEPAAQAAAGRYSASLLEAIDRTLAVQPEQRFPTVTDFQAALRGLGRVANGDETLFLKSRFERVEPGPPLFVRPPAAASVEKNPEGKGRKAFQAFTRDFPPARRKQKAPRSLAETELSGWLQWSQVLLGSGLVAVALLASLAVKLVGLPSATAREEQPPLSYSVTQDGALLAKATAREPLLANHSSLAIPSARLERASEAAAPKLPPDAAPTVEEQPVLLQLAEERAMNPAPLPKGTDWAGQPHSEGELQPDTALVAPPPLDWAGPSDSARLAQPPSMDTLVPNSALKPISQSISVLSPGPAIRPVKARISAITRPEAKEQLLPVDAGRSQQRTEVLVRLHAPSVREAGRSRSWSRSRVANSRPAAKFWRKWGAVRNPWEPPTRTGFNQK